jgi:hypothetical protein
MPHVHTMHQHPLSSLRISAILALAWSVLSLVHVSAALARVKIVVPAQHYKVHEKIPAKVENINQHSVTLCVEFGQTSSNAGEIESTPSPFRVQRNIDGKWGTLIIGPDVGSLRAAVVLNAGESYEFPFRLIDSGTMRLQLNYWRGSTPDLDCHAPPKGRKLQTSANFTVE